MGGIIGLTNASLLAALVVTGCAVLALAAALTDRIPRLALILPTIVCLALLAAGAHAADLRAAKRATVATFNSGPSWVEPAKPGPTLFVQTPGSNPYGAMPLTVMNPSIVQARPLGTKGILTLDGLSKSPVSLDESGKLIDGDTGTPIQGSVVFATGGSEFVFDGRDRVVTDRFFSLVLPHAGTVRVRAFANGVRSNNTVAGSGSLTAYPPGDGTCGVVSLRMTLPSSLSPTVLEFRDGAGTTQTYTVNPGKLTTVKVRPRRLRHAA